MARTDTLGHFLTDVADAIREKTGESEAIQASAFDTAISNIPSGGGKYTPRWGQITFTNYTGTELDNETENLDTRNLTSLEKMFYYCPNLTSLDLSEFNTTSATNMSAMFGQCSKITSVDVSGFDTHLVTTMNNMFGACSILPSINLSNFSSQSLTNTVAMFSGDKQLTSITFGNNFDMSSVTNASSMFYNCSKLENLDMSMFNWQSITDASSMFYYTDFKTLTLPSNGFSNINGTKCSELFKYCYSVTQINNLKIANITNGSNMFNGCRRLTSVDMSQVFASSPFSMQSMFYDCGQLQHIDIRNFDLGNITSYSNMLSYVPTSCEIIVKDATSKTWMNTNFSSYTNVKTVAEYEAE